MTSPSTSRYARAGRAAAAPAAVLVLEGLVSATAILVVAALLMQHIA
jgi:hypothetical protein